MIGYAIHELSKLLGGELFVPEGVSAPETVSGEVETDSRRVKPGGIFFALPGEQSDGHLFAQDAVDNGAVLIISREKLELLVSQIIVSDGLDALSTLAGETVARVRANGNLKVIGITGSNGKTSTKNLLRDTLAKFGATVAPEGSYNNRVGAPLSMLRVTKLSRYLIVEMGASAPGEIARLAEIAKPDVGVVLNVGLAHAGGFGGIDATAKAKTELLLGLSANAVAVLNADDLRVWAMGSKTQARVLSFGQHLDADVRAEDTHSDISGTGFTLVVDSARESVRLRLLGEHQVTNALAALTVSHALGLDINTAISGLSETWPEKWRMQLTERNDGVAVINDAYNASPDSMAAALKALAQFARHTGRRVLAVLGEMAELGSYSDAEHDAIGRLAVRLGIDQLVVVGEAARHIHLGASREGSFSGESLLVQDADQAYDALNANIRPGDIVLVKASNFARLGLLGERLSRRGVAW